MCVLRPVGRAPGEHRGGVGGAANSVSVVFGWCPLWYRSISCILNYRLITDLGTTASVVNYVLPIVAIILGAAILSDHITPQIVLGMLIVLAGVALTRRDNQPAKPRNDQSSRLPN